MKKTLNLYSREGKKIYCICPDFGQELNAENANLGSGSEKSVFRAVTEEIPT